MGSVLFVGVSEELWFVGGIFFGCSWAVVIGETCCNLVGVGLKCMYFYGLSFFILSSMEVKGD